MIREDVYTCDVCGAAGATPYGDEHNVFLALCDECIGPKKFPLKFRVMYKLHVVVGQISCRLFWINHRIVNWLKSIK